jgi:hypothetical protein
VPRAVYGDLVEAQLAAATARQGEGDLARLLAGSDTWAVE